MNIWHADVYALDWLCACVSRKIVVELVQALHIIFIGEIHTIPRKLSELDGKKWILRRRNGFSWESNSSDKKIVWGREKNGSQTTAAAAAASATSNCFYFGILSPIFFSLIFFFLRWFPINVYAVSMHHNIWLRIV